MCKIVLFEVFGAIYNKFTKQWLIFCHVDDSIPFSRSFAVLGIVQCALVQIECLYHIHTFWYVKV